MLSENNIIVILYSLPIYQQLFYTIQLVTFKKANPSRKYLGLLLLTMTLFLIINALFRLGNDESLYVLYYVFIPLLLLLPPAFYYYVIFLVRKRNKIKSFTKLILFLPGCIVLLLNLFTSGWATALQREMFLLHSYSLFKATGGPADTSLIVLWLSLLILLSIQLIHTALSVRVHLKAEKAAVQQQPEHLAYLQFRWVYIISASSLVFITAGTLHVFFSRDPGLASSAVFNILMLISGGLAGYFGLKQDVLLEDVSGVGSMRLSPDVKGANADPDVKMQAISVKEFPAEEVAVIIKKIEALMQQEKPFLKKRYSVNDLCRRIDVKRNILTIVINEIMGTNFYGLVNDYRIREAIQIMETDLYNLTIDAIADMVGFHSRSSFYACFKKYTGQTPTEFIAKQEKNSAPESRPGGDV